MEVVSVLKLLEASVPLVCVAFVPAGRPPLAGYWPNLLRNKIYCDIALVKVIANLRVKAPRVHVPAEIEIA